MSNENGKLSRRVVLGCGAGAVVVGFGLRAEAQGSIPPEQVMYVEKTQLEDRFCANCLHWKGTPVASLSEVDQANPEMADCALVAGKVAATGWCGVWAARG